MPDDAVCVCVCLPARKSVEVLCLPTFLFLAKQQIYLMSFENERLQSKQLPLVIERPQAIKFQI